MKTFWIVVADAGRALVLSWDGDDETLAVVHEIENPVGRVHTSNMVADHRGRVEKKGSQSAMEAPTDPHEQTAINFARLICDLLNEGVNRREFDNLILIAPGHFLGLLHGHLTKTARSRLTASETKDLTHSSLAEIEPHVQKLIQQSAAADFA